VKGKAPQLLTPEQIATVTRLWSEGQPLWVIGLEARLGMDRLKRRLKDQLTLPPRPRRANSNRRGVLPTEDEIQFACASIRQRWPEDRWLPSYEVDGNRLGRQAERPTRPIG
jgi:hypothetical protein